MNKMIIYRTDYQDSTNTGWWIVTFDEDAKRLELELVEGPFRTFAEAAADIE